MFYSFSITYFVGFTGGSHYTHKGAAVEPICLPKNPEWGLYNDGHDGAKNYVYGAEYETGSFTGYIKTIEDNDVPCVVCLVRRKSVVQMFPGRFEYLETDVLLNFIHFQVSLFAVLR